MMTQHWACHDGLPSAVSLWVCAAQHGAMMAWYARRPKPRVYLAFMHIICSWTPMVSFVNNVTAWQLHQGSLLAPNSHHHC